MVRTKNIMNLVKYCADVPCGLFVVLASVWHMQVIRMRPVMFTPSGAPLPIWIIYFCPFQYLGSVLSYWTWNFDLTRNV